ADEDDVDAGCVGEPPARRVVGGDHHDLLAAALHLRELRQRELPVRPRRVLRRFLLAHCNSPSRMTLSMRRVGPTRAATARTCASFWPKYATSGRTMLNSFRHTVATPRK